MMVNQMRPYPPETVSLHKGRDFIYLYYLFKIFIYCFSVKTYSSCQIYRQYYTYIKKEEKNPHK